MGHITLMEQPHSFPCFVIIRVVRVSEIPMGTVCLAPGSASRILLCCHHVIVSAIHFKNHQDDAFKRVFRDSCMYSLALEPIHTK